MAQPTQQYPPRAFSPPNASSPQGSYPPAAKRPRLSPNGQSPYNSPSMNNISLPSQVFSQPYHGNQTNGATQPSYNQSQQWNSNTAFQGANYNNLNTPVRPPAHSPPATPATNNMPNAMGPPTTRPEREKPPDLAQLGDVLTGSGIDERFEESFHYRTSNNDQGTNFIDQLQQASKVNNQPQRNNVYSQNVPGDKGSFYGSGTFNQPAQAKTAEEIAEAAERKAIRKEAEIKQYHLNNPFLSAGSLHVKLEKEAQKLHVKIPSKNEDILKPRNKNIPPQSITIHGPDNNDVVRVVQGEPLLTLKTSLAEIYSLMSLAAEERVRMFVEDAVTLAKGRRIGSSGLVPQEMSELAVKQENGDAAPTLPILDGAVSPKDNPLKRSYNDMNGLPVDTSKPLPKPTNPVTQTLQRLAKEEREAEEKRLAKRKQRAEKAEASSRAASLSLDSSAPGTPGPSGLPDIAPEPKKSALKNKKPIQTDAQALGATNKSINMALGGGNLIGGRKISWLTSAAPSGQPSNPYLAARKAGEAVKANKDAPPGANLPSLRQWGYEESGNMELRDLISVLEHDGKEKRALQRAYMKMNGSGPAGGK